MHPGFKNVLGVFIGILVGMGVNIGLVTLGPILIPPPMDADLTTMEGLEASMHLMEPKHFLMPWLAHALGSFVGGLIAYLISGTNKMRSAYIVVFFFFLGGIANVTMLPSPLWFNIGDLGLAYIPMGFLACYFGKKLQNSHP